LTLFTWIIIRFLPKTFFESVDVVGNYHNETLEVEETEPISFRRRTSEYGLNKRKKKL